jgi:hypothetical protein
MKTLLRSFAGGEITPELYGRLDLTKFQTGLALARNFTTLPHGPATRRPGFKFINEVQNSNPFVGPGPVVNPNIATRLIPFVYSADQAVVLEFGGAYIRFYVAGAAVLESNKGIVGIIGSTVSVTAHGYSTGDDVYIGNRFHRITVTGANTFTTADLWGNATTPSGSLVARVYTLPTPYDFSILFGLRFTQDADVLTICHPDYATRELRRLGPSSWTLTTVSFTPSTAVPTGLSVTATVGTAGNQNPQSYVITAVASDGITESLPSDPVSTSNNLTVSGNFNTLRWTPDSSVYRYRLYKQRGGIYGYIGQAGVLTGKTISSITRVGTTATLTTATAHGLATGDVVRVSGATPAQYNGTFTITVTSTTTFTYTMASDPGASASPVGTYIAIEAIVDDNVLADTTVTPPENLYTLNDASGKYPGAVTHYEQRRWFAGSTNEPQTIYATRSATLSNLTSSTPSQDDDALQFRIAAQQNNTIRHLAPLADLIALTAGGEFRIYADSAPAITPTSLSVKPQGYSGAANVQPALTTNSLLYVQAQGSRIRELAYSWESSAYTSIDVSIMAPHLFNGYTVKDVAYSRAPVPTLWCVRSDGVLLGLTHVPEQQVYGWHQHTTDGAFESVCVVPEASEDVLYVTVLRTVNGRAVRYIERLQSRTLVAQADAFFVDSGLSYYSTPVSSVSGLWHLEGKQVQILVDGAVHPPRTVSGGSVTLDASYSTIHVGLAYNSDLQTLPLALDGAPAAGQYMRKNVNGVALRVTQSNLVKAGPSFAKLTEFPARDHTDPYGSPPALKTGELRFAIGPSWNSDGSVCLRQDQPLPLTVLGIAVDVATGG